MKIVFLISSLKSGGAQRFLTLISAYLVARGYYVSVITFDSSGSDFFELSEGVERDSIEDLTGRKRSGSIGYISALFFIRRYLKEKSPNIAVSIGTTNNIMLQIASIGLPVRTILSERNHPESQKIFFGWRALRFLVYRYGSAHLAQTERTALWLKNSLSAQNVFVVPNPIEIPVDTMGDPLNPGGYIDGESKVVLAVGNKLFQKGFDVLLPAFDLASRRNEEWVLVIIGLDSESDKKNGSKEKILKMSEALGVSDRVILPGSVGNIQAWYDACDIFVLSSRFEGFPNVLLEAMASGCACVSTNCPTGPQELIADGVDGILVPSVNVESLAGGIFLLMEDECLRRRVSTQAKSIKDRYSLASIGCSVETILSELSDD